MAKKRKGVIFLYVLKYGCEILKIAENRKEEY